MSSDPSKHGLVARGAPVKPPLFKMPQKMGTMQCESDRAHGGGITVTGRTQMDNHGSYYQQKHKAEKFDSGLDEITQYRLNDPTAITPVSCTDDALSEYVYQPKIKTMEKPIIRTKPMVESHTDISDSAIELSASSKKTRIDEEQPKIDSKILRTVHHLFVEDEDGERLELSARNTIVSLAYHESPSHMHVWLCPFSPNMTLFVLLFLFVTHSMLHLSVIFENRVAVRQLLKVINMFPMLQCCLNDQNKMKQTALHLAVNLNLTGVVEELILAGAELDLQDINGNTPFHIVCKKGLLQCMDVFLSIVNSERLRKIAELTNNEGEKPS